MEKATQQEERICPKVQGWQVNKLVFHPDILKGDIDLERNLQYKPAQFNSKV